QAPQRRTSDAPRYKPPTPVAMASCGICQGNRTVAAAGLDVELLDRSRLLLRLDRRPQFAAGRRHCPRSRPPRTSALSGHVRCTSKAEINRSFRTNGRFLNSLPVADFIIAPAFFLGSRKLTDPSPAQVFPRLGKDPRQKVCVLADSPVGS